MENGLYQLNAVVDFSEIQSIQEQVCFKDEDNNITFSSLLVALAFTSYFNCTPDNTANGKERASDKVRGLSEPQFPSL